MLHFDVFLLGKKVTVTKLEVVVICHGDKGY
uniref:Uncharacterized protein n=1 Tax=Arundo donax TaxID=35708 RepID=A0A0A8ZSB3_ARUDO